MTNSKNYSYGLTFWQKFWINLVFLCEFNWSVFCLMFMLYIAYKCTYSPSHIVQIMDFLEFLHIYCKEKSETSTKSWTSFVVTKNIGISFWPAALVKNQHKRHFHREFTCKRDITLPDPWRKLSCILGVHVPFVTIFAANIFILHQLHFHANKVKFYAFLKIHIL